MVKYRYFNSKGSEIDPGVLAASVLFLGTVFSFGCVDAPSEPFPVVEAEAFDSIDIVSGPVFSRESLLDNGEANGDGTAFKMAAAPCAGRSGEDPCTTETREEGLCIDGGNGILTCTVVEPCYNSVEGESCTTQWRSPGVCMDYFASNLHCEPQGTCVTSTEGARCETEFKEIGSCAPAGRGGLLYCRLKDPCDGKTAMEPCTQRSGMPGECVDVSRPDDGSDVGGPSTNLYCREIE